MDRITHARVSRALIDFYAYNTTQQWARLRIDTMSKPVQVSLEIGRIYSNGFEECENSTRYYIWSGERGVRVIHNSARS